MDNSLKQSKSHKIFYQCQFCKVFFETLDKCAQHQTQKHKDKDIERSASEAEMELLSLDHTTADLVKLERIKRLSASAINSVQCHKCQARIKRPYNSNTFCSMQNSNSPLQIQKIYCCKPSCSLASL